MVLCAVSNEKKLGLPQVSTAETAMMKFPPDVLKPERMVDRLLAPYTVSMASHGGSLRGL